MGDASRCDSDDLAVETMPSFLRPQVPFKNWKRDAKQAFERFPTRASRSVLVGSARACSGQS
eukprot:2718756-Pyramimonas_sp.AAC.1